MERIGLDRIDFAGRPPRRDEQCSGAEREPAERRHRDRQQRIERDDAGQPLARRQAE
jgi:hypothetical protein